MTTPRPAKGKKKPLADLKAEKLPISVLKPDPANPRTMTDPARAGLAVSLETFGPLDIVFNLHTGELVSGHQRVESLKAAGATEVIREGGWHYIVHPKTAERFVVRFVDWDKEKQRLANLTANNGALQGSFTSIALTQLEELKANPQFVPLKLDDLKLSIQSLEMPAPGGDGGSSGYGKGAGDQSVSLSDSWQIVITCKSENHQREMLDRFEKEGLPCRALI